MKKSIFRLKRKLNLSNLKDSISFQFSKSPIVYYWDYEKNWGDTINEFIFLSVIGRKAYSANRVFNIKNKEIITGIGSVLNSTLNNYSIWGSGFLSEYHSLTNPPNEVLALRGLLTQKKVKGLFGKTTDVFGDPGLLFREYFNPIVKKEYSVGVIPHFKEIQSSQILEIKRKFQSDVNLIDPTWDIFEFATEVKKCEVIISSSLHGLVLAESYGIPTSRIIFSNKLIGGDFKFDDYYSGVKIDSSRFKSIVYSEEVNLNEFKKSSTLKDLNYSSENLISALRSKIL